MKEKNQPEIEQPTVVVEEIKKEELKKRERKYIAQTTQEINDLIDTYRKLLRVEANCERELLTAKIIELERELKYRGKLDKSTK